MYQGYEVVYIKGVSSWVYEGGVQSDVSKRWSCIFQGSEQLGVWRGVKVDVSNGCSSRFKRVC